MTDLNPRATAASPGFTTPHTHPPGHSNHPGHALHPQTAPRRPRKRWWQEKDGLSVQIVTACLVSLFLVILTSLAIAASLTLKDRRAYLLEVQYYKMHTAALAVRAALDRLPLNQEFVPQSVAPQDVARLYGLPRLPGPGEIFMGRVNGALTAIMRRPARQGEPTRFASGPVSPLRLCPHFKGVCYATTSFGAFIASTTPSYTAASMITLPAVQHFLTNGLNEGQHWANASGFLPSAVTSYRELPKTNIVLFAESSVLEFFFPAARLVAASLLVLFCAAAILVGILGSRLNALLRPLGSLLKDFGRLSKGQFELPPLQTGSKELNRLYEGLSTAGQMLRVRETAILGLHRDLAGVLELSHALALAEDAPAVFRAAAEHFIHTIAPEGHWRMEVHIFASPSEHHAAREPGRDDTLQGPLGGALALHGAHLKTILMAENDRPGTCGPVSSTDGRSETAQQTFRAALAQAQRPDQVGHLTQICCPAVYQSMPVALFRFACEGLRALTTAERQFLQLFTDTLGAALTSTRARAELHEKALIDVQLQAAGAIQRQFSPHVPAQLGTLHWAALFRPAERVGGDFYTVNLLAGQRWALFFVGDATGHGIEAALLTGVTYGLMASTQALFDSQAPASAHSPIPETLRVIARLMSDTIERAGRHKIWMTASLIAIDTQTGAGHYLSAGHPPALLFTPGGKTTSLRLQSGLLGDGSGSGWVTGELNLPPGGALVVYSDGLVENHLPEGEPVKIKRLMTLLAREVTSAQSTKAAPEPRALLDVITRSVPHLGQPPHPAADDTTVLVITRRA